METIPYEWHKLLVYFSATDDSTQLTIKTNSRRYTVITYNTFPFINGTLLYPTVKRQRYPWKLSSTNG